MEAKHQDITPLLEEGADYPQQQRYDFPLQTRDNQPQQTDYQPPQASYLPQQVGFQPQQGSYAAPQASYLPPQASYPTQQASYRPPQAGYLPQQGRCPPQQIGTPLQQAGHQPQQNYAQPPHQGQETTKDVIHQQPSVPSTVGVGFGESPVTAVCPHCRVTVVSTVHQVPGNKTLLCCLLLCFIGCSAGCCFFPFCMDDCLDVVHACPFCKNKIGVYLQPL